MFQQSLNSKISRYASQSKDSDINTIWAKAVGELVKEVRKTVFKQLKENKISARKLFLLSAWSLRELMATVNHPKYLKEDVRLIDEQRFIQALMDAVLKKRKINNPQNCRRQNSADSGIMMNQSNTTQPLPPQHRQTRLMIQP